MNINHIIKYLPIIINGLTIGCFFFPALIITGILYAPFYGFDVVLWENMDTSVIHHAYLLGENELAKQITLKELFNNEVFIMTAKIGLILPIITAIYFYKKAKEKSLAQF
jgi:hypothetical protein